ncbi:MAG: SMP-30/gluconolactonase/LRE family protein [Acidobacteriota bacterium]|nr:SMP-30/gluconolactonase/LRE family protein [Acidobacteriota bacterium]
MRFSLLLTALAWPLWAQSPGIPGVVAPGAEPELVKDGFLFTEGPVGTPDGGLYFTDLRANKIYKIDPEGKITTVRMNTGGANGLALNGGELYAAEGTAKLISRGNQNGRNTTVIDTSNAPLLAAPNDLIFDIRGGIYFTDPGDTPLFPKDPGQFGKVYYVATAVGIPPYAIDDTISRPNGLTLTLDGRYLLVDDTLGDTIWAFDIQPKGKSKGIKKTAFAKITLLTKGESLADGMAIDREGRVYVTTGAGIQVFDKKGKFLGNIKVPKQPSNVAFSGPDKKTLYITARDSVYKLKMLSQGPERQGK